MGKVKEQKQQQRSREDEADSDKPNTSAGVARKNETAIGLDFLDFLLFYEIWKVQSSPILKVHPFSV